MATTPATCRRQDGTPSNWGRYLDLVIDYGVPEKNRPWYLRQAVAFPKALRPESRPG